MPVTLFEIRNDCRSRLNEYDEKFWLDAELDRWINEATRDIARRTETIQSYNENIRTRPDQAKYPLPHDVIRVHRVEWDNESGMVYPLEPSTYGEMDQLWGSNQTRPSNYPGYFVLWGSAPAMVMQLWPVPSAAGLLHVYYYRMPRRLAEDGDLVEIPEGWHDLVPLYVEYVARRKDKDQTWAEAKQLYEANLNHMIDMTRQWHDQAQSVIMGNRGLPFGIWGGDEY